MMKERKKKIIHRKPAIIVQNDMKYFIFILTMQFLCKLISEKKSKCEKSRFNRVRMQKWKKQNDEYIKFAKFHNKRENIDFYSGAQSESSEWVSV